MASLLSSPLVDIDDIRASIYESLAEFRASYFRFNTTVILREMGFFLSTHPQPKACCYIVNLILR